MTNLENMNAFVTGANRGIGLTFVEELLNAGTGTIYAGARNVEALADLAAAHGDRLVPVELDVTDPEMAEQAAKIASTTQLLFNNAGLATFDNLSSAQSIKSARDEMEVNYFGTLNMIRAFAPVLAANGNGTIVNIASIAGLVSLPAFPSYSASKAAVHSLTQGVRAELSSKGITVVGVYPGPVDTEMGANLPIAKASPKEIVSSVLEAVAAGVEDVYPDAMSRQIHAGLTADAKAVEKQMAAMAAGA